MRAQRMISAGAPWFDLELAWLSRVLSLTRLAEAAAHDPNAVPKHLLWVNRTFVG